MKSKILTILAAGTLGLLPGAIEACCMVPRGHDVVIGQNMQEAIVMHHGDRQEMVLRINYKITKKTESAKLPGYFTWIITVPNEPDQYEIAESSIFKTMYKWVEENGRPKEWGQNILPSLGVDSARMHKGGVELGKRVKVGPYDIQPVRGVGKDALTGLNKWLGDNGFPKEDPDHMKWFIDNKFTFLAIKVNKAEGEKSVSDGGDLPPIHMSFKSENPYYPLRFSSRQGVFDLNLYLMTTDKFDYEKSGEALKKLNFKPTGYLKNIKSRFDDGLLNFAPVLPKDLRKIWKKSKVKGENTWYLNVLRTRKINQAYPISKWKDDVFFRTIT